MLANWALNRFFRLIPVWVQVVGFGLVALLVAWQTFFYSSASGSLAGYNHTDRPIFRYWVNGKYGGNMWAHSWGGTTCCWSFKGDSAEVVWVLSITGEQERQGVEIERHSVTLPMPEYSREDQYLHVHFLPGNKVDLIWSSEIRSPKFEYYHREIRQND